MEVIGHCIPSYWEQTMSIPWWWRGSVVISWEDYTWPGVSSEQYCYPSEVQWGVTLWGEPRPLSTTIGPGDINFPWQADMIANLLHWHSEGTGPKPQQAELRQDCSFFVIRHQIPCPESCQSSLCIYVNHVNSETLSQICFVLGFSEYRIYNFMNLFAEYSITYISFGKTCRIRKSKTCSDKSQFLL